MHVPVFWSPGGHPHKPAAVPAVEHDANLFTLIRCMTGRGGGGGAGGCPQSTMRQEAPGLPPVGVGYGLDPGLGPGPGPGWEPGGCKGTALPQSPSGPQEYAPVGSEFVVGLSVP